MRVRSLAVLATVAALFSSCATPPRAEPDEAVAFKMLHARLLTCYARHWEVAGQVRTVLLLTLLPDGSVENVQVLETTVDDPDAAACVVERLLRWKTPLGSAARRTVKYTLQLR